MSDTWMLYEGEREGNHSINSRVGQGKYTVMHGVPFKIAREDLWIASLRGYSVLSQVDFVPTTNRQPSPDESYLSKWEAAFLEGLAASLPNPTRLVEVGTGKGVSLGRLLLGLSLHTDVLVWTIDLQECEKAADYVSECQIPNWRYKFLVGDSAEIGSQWQEPLNMIYLDGSHTYEGVCKDVAAWYPHLADKGILVFHDYGNRKHEVTKAVDDSMKDLSAKKVGRVGFLVAYEKG